MELYVGILKEAVRKNVKEVDSPLKFWDYCVECKARVHNLADKNFFQYHGSNLYTELVGDEGVISNLCKC